MTDTDIIWATVWFIVGLLVFQVKGIKSFFDVMSGLVFASLHKMTKCSKEMCWFLRDFSLDMWVRDF